MHYTNKLVYFTPIFSVKLIYLYQQILTLKSYIKKNNIFYIELYLQINFIQGTII